MHRGASLKEDSSFLRHYLWKYRRFVGIGLFTLVVLNLTEILPPIFMKRAIDLATEGPAAAGGVDPRRELIRLAAIYLFIALVQGICRRKCCVKLTCA